MKFTKEEIVLAKKLHELGVRKEIKYGDWYFYSDGEPLLNHNKICGIVFPTDAIPLWQIHDCLEWLRDKRYKQGDLHWDENLIGKQVSNVYVETSDNRGMFVKDKFKHAKTPLGALLKVMVAIAKETK